MKILRPYDYVNTPMTPDSASLTVAGQALTLPELLVRYAKGLSLTDNGMHLFDGGEDPDSLDFDDDEDPMLNPNLDLCDVEDYRVRLLEKLNSSRRDSSVRINQEDSGSPKEFDDNSDESGEGNSSSIEA